MEGTNSKRDLTFSDVCRVCAEPSSILINLFSTREKSILLVEMLVQCARIEISDGRPTSICNECVQNLIVAYDFQCLAQMSEDKFQKLIFGKDVDGNSSNCDIDDFFREDDVSIDMKEAIKDLSNGEIRNHQVSSNIEDVDAKLLCKAVVELE